MHIPASSRIVVIITGRCIDEPNLMGTFVFATFGSCMLKKKFPKPAAKPCVICCEALGSTCIGPIFVGWVKLELGIYCANIWFDIYILTCGLRDCSVYC